MAWDGWCYNDRLIWALFREGEHLCVQYANGAVDGSNADWKDSRLLTAFLLVCAGVYQCLLAFSKCGYMCFVLHTHVTPYKVNTHEMGKGTIKHTLKTNHGCVSVRWGPHMQVTLDIAFGSKVLDMVKREGQWNTFILLSRLRQLHDLGVFSHTRCL